jgi:hypothetical protein
MGFRGVAGETTGSDSIFFTKPDIWESYPVSCFEAVKRLDLAAQRGNKGKVIGFDENGLGRGAEGSLSRFALVMRQDLELAANSHF